jgi:BlaI family transcriptional regulator, penicillinase repressor
MDVLYRLERATAAEVREGLVPPPSYSTVRAQLRVLEEKGHIRHQDDGLRYVYMPVVSRKSARRSALLHLVETFFDGSAENAVAALLGGEVSPLTGEELARVSRMIDAARKEESQC